MTDFCGFQLSQNTRRLLGLWQDVPVASETSGIADGNEAEKLR